MSIVLRIIEASVAFWVLAHILEWVCAVAARILTRLSCAHVRIYESPHGGFTCRRCSKHFD